MAALLVFGLICPASFPAAASEVLSPEPVTDLTSVTNPDLPTGGVIEQTEIGPLSPTEQKPPIPPAEGPAPALIEVSDAATMTAQMSLESETLVAEPELVWSCETTYDGDGNEYERCGLGYYRELCYVSGGEEICETFFEFYEEEPDYLQEALDELFTYDVLEFSLAWNGIALSSDAGTLPGGNGMLGWSYVLPTGIELAELHDMFPPEALEAALAETVFTLQIYEGPLASSTLVYSEELGPATSGEIALSLPHANEYHVFLLVTARSERISFCNEGGSGDLCPYLNPRIEAFEWFMRYGAVCNTTDDEVPALCYDPSDPNAKPDGSHIPLIFGTYAFSVEESRGVSNILFLPGIKGSRLYRPSQTCDPELAIECPRVRLWEPPARSLLEYLYLLSDGQSLYTDIYVREGDIMDTVLGQHFYASFVNQMDALKTDGSLVDWRAVAYDWRLSLDDIVNKGTQVGDRIYFHEDTDEPYIEKTLRALAASSPTGKVSIVAHSNGGLVAKRLMQRLADEGDQGLVDKIILVGVPQSGAPQAMAGLLYGYGEALPYDGCSERAFTGWLCAFFSSRDIARTLAEHSPMAYHLLPSEAYFDQVRDGAHPVAKFNALQMYSEERARYGSAVDSAQELYDFLAALDGGRTKPEATDTASADVLDTGLLSYARSIHEETDAWVPPPGVAVYQIAGWGANTIAGVEFYEQRKLLGGYKEMYRPIFVEDGDGVVPVPSALALSTDSPQVQNYWIDLNEVKEDGERRFVHGNILELDEVRILLRKLIMETPEDLPRYISSSQPESESKEKLVFYLHSPLSPVLKDLEGNVLSESNGVEYGEFGEVKYLIAPSDDYILTLNGYALGSFSLEIQSISSGEVTSSIAFADIPSTPETFAEILISEKLEDAGDLRVDQEDDGSFEVQIEPVVNDVIIYSPITIDTSPENTHDTRSSTTKESGWLSSSTQISSATTSQFDGLDITHELATFREIPALIKSAAEANNLVTDVSQVSKTESANSDLYMTPATNLTASVYEAIGGDFVKVFLGVLYNFFVSILSLIQGFTSRL